MIYRKSKIAQTRDTCAEEIFLIVMAEVLNRCHLFGPGLKVIEFVSDGIYCTSPGDTRRCQKMFGKCP